MRAFVGVTDGDWYAFLRDRPDLSEVNFWRPGRTPFKAIGVGEPFLFKTHHPHDRLVGGGFFSGFQHLRLSEAWRFFGPANGCESLAQMHARIGFYRRGRVAEDDPTIGCILLRDVTFVAETRGLPAPADFARNIVSGKGYPIRLGEGSAVERALVELLALPEAGVSAVPGAVFGDSRLAPYRLGQRAFRAMVFGAYGRRCAVTGAKITPALQAAHIRPVRHQGENRLDNGLLLRSDVHTMYDQGYLGVDAQHRLHVSPRIMAEFHNGEEFYALHGRSIAVPERAVERPAADFLTWHMDTIFSSG